MNDRLRIVRDLLLEALEINDEQQRAAFLARACPKDPALRREVEELLAAQTSAGHFLPDRPTSNAAKALGVRDAVTGPAPASGFEESGERIGRYTLLQKLGEGGCGVVYMAEQEEPVRRNVALKVIKLGMDTESVVARFEAERQALALMDHPNIARVLDAGATDTGRPYFVMELVRGIRITDYCDQHTLSTNQRLELFIQVCRAVQHAHQKGIIHRDLKPSNILVADHDPGSPGVPKVIDFGVAKATAGQILTDKTLFTALEQFIGTPTYMSPEQAQLSGLDIDTRTDVYSLGVLLYELLTGRTPFDSKRLAQAGFDEVRRIIREENPAKPSTRLSMMDLREQATVAKARQCEVPRLLGLIRGDLDWVVMKCLEKDRNRRYETANGLAADIRRHLDNEPVIARPPSRLYEFQKTVRRHWVGFSATGLVVVSLAGGLAFSTVSYFREQLARSEALRQAALAYSAQTNAVKELRGSLLAEAKALRWSHRAGRRFDGLALLKKAAAIRPGPDLRNEAIACMVLTDFKMGREFNFKTEDGLGMVFDPDYERYVVSGGHGAISMRSSLDDRELARLPGYESPFWDVQFSPNGRYMYIGYGPQHDRIEIRDLLSGKQLMALSGLNFRFVGFSDDCAKLVMAIESEKDNFPVRIYSLPSGEQLATFPHGSLPWGIHMNPIENDFLISSDATELVRIWNWKNGDVVTNLSHPNAVYGVSWSPAGRLIATACYDGNVRLWESNGTVRAVLPGHEAAAVQLTFSSDGALLASRGWDGRLCLWDVPGEHEIAMMEAPGFMCGFGHRNRKLAVFTSDSSTHENIYKLLEVTDGCGFHVLHMQNKEDKAINCDFRPDGQFLVSANLNSLSLWDPVSGNSLARYPCSEGKRFALFHSNGTNLFVGSEAGLEEWDLTNSPTVRFGGISLRQEWPVQDTWHHMTLGNDRKIIAFTSRGAVQVRDTDSGRRIMQTSPKGYEASSLSLDGRLVAAWREDFTSDPLPKPQPQVDVWEVATTNLLQSVPCSVSTFAAFSPNNRWLAIGDDAKFQLRDVLSWKPIYTFPREFAGFWGFVAFSPDSAVLAVAISRSKVQLREAATARELATLEAPEPSEITWITFDSDGTRLAVVCQNGSIQLWDLRAIREQLASMNLDWDLPPYPPLDKPPDTSSTEGNSDTPPMSGSTAKSL